MTQNRKNINYCVPKETVLVLGSDMRGFLSVVRSLGRAGLAVHAASADHTSGALRSRYIERVLRLPRYECGAKEWIIAVNGLIKRFGYAAVFPCDDQNIIPLEIHRDEIIGARLILPSKTGFEVFSDKWKTKELAVKKGIPVPYSEKVASGEQLSSIAARIGYPLVIKPLRSFTAANLTVRNKVEIIRDERRLSAFCKNIRAGEIIAQQYFDGIGIGLSTLSENGDLLAAFQYRRVHEPRSGGGSSYRRSEPIDGELFDAVKTLCKEVSYTGLAMFEFRSDGKTKRWVLLEVNARPWGSLPLAIAAGIDFPAAAYRVFTSKGTSLKTSYSSGVFSRNLKADLFYYASEAGPDRPIRLMCDMAGALKRLVLNKERVDSFCISDNKPFVSEIAGIVSMALRKVTGRISVIRKLSAFMERRRFRSALRSAPGGLTIVFVCQGNICRSPFAERALRNELAAAGLDKKIMVGSCGVLPFENRESPAFAGDAARKYSVELGDNASKYIEKAGFSEKAVFVVFDEKTRQDMMAIYPDISSRILHLGALSGADGMRDIEDPYGKDIKVFDDVYGRISMAINNLASRYIPG